jgi:hypothetical protein
MPSDEAAYFVRGLGAPSPEKLRTVAARYGVSLQVAAIKVHSRLKLWTCFVGLWERHPVIKTLWFVGQRRWDTLEPDSYSLDLALSRNASVESSELWRKGPCSDPVFLRLLRLGKGKVLGLVNYAR